MFISSIYNKIMIYNSAFTWFQPRLERLCIVETEDIIESIGKRVGSHPIVIVIRDLHIV